MCGIVAGIAERNVTPILLEGLRRLEYRGQVLQTAKALSKNGYGQYLMKLLECES